MKPSVLQEALVRAFESRQNILITGAPGIGKSDIVNQSVTQAGGDLILSHPVCSDPTDFKGYPFPVENSHADFLPFSDLLKLMDANVVWVGPGMN
jgi:midasin (ATPase involved in ribosome maturation)